MNKLQSNGWRIPTTNSCSDIVPKVSILYLPWTDSNHHKCSQHKCALLLGSSVPAWLPGSSPCQSPGQSWRRKLPGGHFGLDRSPEDLSSEPRRPQEHHQGQGRDEAPEGRDGEQQQRVRRKSDVTTGISGRIVALWRHEVCRRLGFRAQSQIQPLKASTRQTIRRWVIETVAWQAMIRNQTHDPLSLQTSWVKGHIF